MRKKKRIKKYDDGLANTNNYYPNLKCTKKRPHNYYKTS